MGLATIDAFIVMVAAMDMGIYGWTYLYIYIYVFVYGLQCALCSGKM